MAVFAAACVAAVISVGLPGNAQAGPGDPVLRGLPFSIVGSGDFDGFGKADILWHNANTGETQIWVMDGNLLGEQRTVVGEDGRLTFVGPPFSIVGVGDLNGNGRADIVWHNANTGETQVWFMNGNRVVQRATVVGENGQPILVGPPFGIVGAGDLNDNGRADIVWHNANTGETQIWFMNGNRVVQRATVVDEAGRPTSVGPPFSIVGVGDRGNIVWHNADTGETQVWFMNGHRRVDRPPVIGEDGRPTFVGPPFSIVGVGDLNGNGWDDIVWHNADTNETQVWFMNANNRVVQRATVIEPPIS